MNQLARGSAVLASLAAFAAVLAWNVLGPGVRALLDAEAAGTLCELSTTHLAGSVLAAVTGGAVLRWALGPSLAGHLGALAALGALLWLAGLSLEADSISSLGHFASTNRCLAHEWRGPVLGAILALFAASTAWPRGAPHAEDRPRE